LTYAHSGRTDSKGGHNNLSTGTYHYHSGPYSSDSYNQDYFPPYPPPLCDKKPTHSWGLNGMRFETKEQCLKRFKRQREAFFNRINQEYYERDKKSYRGIRPCPKNFCK